MTRTLLGVLAIGVLTGCGALGGVEHSLPADVPLEPVDEGPDSPDVDGITVTLDEPGAEPRRALRYQAALGTPERLHMAWTASSKGRDYDGSRWKESGSVALDVDLVPRRTKGRGLVEYDVVLRNVAVTSAGAVGSEAYAEVKRDALEGGTAVGVVSTRGLGVQINPRLARIPDRGAAYAVKAIWETVGRSSVPLPLEEIGVGARWQVVDSTRDLGVETTRTRTFTLTSLEDDLGWVDVETRTVAENQSFKVARLPKGTTVVMRRYEALTQGKESFHLRRFTPIEGTSEGTVTSDVLATLPVHGEKTRTSTGDYAGTVRAVRVPELPTPQD